MQREKAFSGSPYEKSVGFCRAIRTGKMITVAGTAPIAPDGSTACPGDAFGQARRCFEIIKSAVEELGGNLSEIYRTRMFITDAAMGDEIGRAHGEFFSDIQPAATMVVVKSLLRDDWFVEIEADCLIE